MIGLANSWTEVNPGHRNFAELARYVILPERELVAGSIEAMSNAHEFDGMVFMCSCDKIVPGMLMAAAALNKPSIFITHGTMIPYESEDGNTYVTPDLKESISAKNAGTIRQHDNAIQFVSKIQAGKERRRKDSNAHKRRREVLRHSYA